MSSLSINQQSFKNNGTIDSYFKTTNNSTNNNNQIIDKVKQFNPLFFTHSGIQSKKGDKYGSPVKLKTFEITESKDRYKIHLPKNTPVLSQGGIYCFENLESGQEYWGSVQKTQKKNCFKKRFQNYQTELNNTIPEARTVIEAIRKNTKAFKLHVIETINPDVTKKDLLARENAYIIRRKATNIEKGYNRKLALSQENMKEIVKERLNQQNVTKTQNVEVYDLCEESDSEKKVITSFSYPVDSPKSPNDEIISLDSPKPKEIEIITIFDSPTPSKKRKFEGAPLTSSSNGISSDQTSRAKKKLFFGN